MKALLFPLLLTTTLALSPRPKPPSDKCPPFSGDFIINYFQLYPENADWDPARCLLWIGCVWNATVATYSPYTHKTTVYEFPGTSHTGSVHIGGVAWDPYSPNLVTILTDSARPWDTAGADVSGEHKLIKWDAVRGKAVWEVDLTRTTGEKYGGFQDVETDRRGNTYVVGTWPGTVLRVDKTGKKVKEWYVPKPLPPTTERGIGGLAVVKGTEVLLASGPDGGLLRFDMTKELGRPVEIKIKNGRKYPLTDAAYLPDRYGGKVILVALGPDGIMVVKSDDGWKGAEYLGTVANRPVSGLEGGFVTAATQVGDAIYIVNGYWDIPWVPGTVAGNRTLFPWLDITADVDRLVWG
ncbi:hypothetical protein B0T16DRAFT_326627 [Cercophora newfieldiana]|uniref:Uncharacterized protein n=1 Tax=Cercophora newfieldiana TaxID=92897 RepID=A0AA40CR36_9PEZI|nr:hypothetical protein B0T16DRAFT_326627 [Cercophora newfieldiana]